MMEHLIKRFCLGDDLSSYDPYDIWKTKLGLSLKIQYYKHPKLLLPIVGLLSIFDLVNTKKIFYKKQEYPIVVALVIQTLYNLKNIHPHIELDNVIDKNIKWLINNHIKTDNGVGWGVNFTLPVSKSIIYPSSTAYSTVTPYILESLLLHRKNKNISNYDDFIKKICSFFIYDLKVMEEDEINLKLSYGTMHDRIITNANSYSMYAFSLCYSNKISDASILKEKINKIYNFIKSTQNNNGSWYYAPYDTNSFIDCFHSCFILKNLVKTKKCIDFDLPDFEKVIEKGYNYILSNFRDSTNLFRRFTQNNKPSFIKYDLYDNAELIGLAVLLEDFDTAKKTIEAVNNYFIKNLDIYSAIDICGVKRRKNNLRWAVIPYLHALTSYYNKHD